MTMVERVARALCVADGLDPDADWRVNNGIMLTVMLDDPRRWLTYRAKARAAIEAMREPTEGMVAAGARAGVDQIYYKYNAWDRCLDTDQQREDWRNVARFSHYALIDAALTEGEG